jgi:hypothetical protein
MVNDNMVCVDNCYVECFATCFVVDSASDYAAYSVADKHRRRRSSRTII